MVVSGGTVDSSSNIFLGEIGGYTTCKKDTGVKIMKIRVKRLCSDL